MMPGGLIGKKNYGMYDEIIPKITANKIKITVDDLTTSNTINCAEFYEKYVLGKFNKKEGNKMIESINLIDLYAKKAEEKLVKDNAIKNAKIRNNDETLKKFNEIMENTIIQLEELYISQLDEKDLLKFREGKKIDSGKYPFVRFEEIDVTMRGAMIDPDFTNDEIALNSLELSKKIDELHDLVKTVKAHVGIAKTKEEVEEILTRYGIIDKKGKLVIK